MDVKVLTLPEVCTILRISQIHGYRLAAKGLLPLIRIGRTYRCTQEMLDKYLRGEWAPKVPVTRGRKRKVYSPQEIAEMTGQMLETVH